MIQQREFVSLGGKTNERALWPPDPVCEGHNSARCVLIFFQAWLQRLYGKTTARRISGA